MTPEEIQEKWENICTDALIGRADDLFLHLLPSYRRRPWSDRAAEVRAVASYIQGILDEAWGRDDRDHFEKVRKRAAELAYEHAAKIAERWCCKHECEKQIAQNIRARAKKVGK